MIKNIIKKNVIIKTVGKSVALFTTLVAFSFSTHAAKVEKEVKGLELPVSINALMVTLIDHSAHYVWDYAETSRKRKLSNKEWQIIEYYSVQLAASGSLITLGGTGVGDTSWSKNKEWRKLAKEMSDAGLLSLKAAREKDGELLRVSGDQLIDSCLACHNAFKPDVPTEGIMHNPEYDHLYHLQRSEK